jgi:hypothetical protein
MANQIEIDWTVTIEIDGVLILENDVRVEAMIDEDQVLVENIEIIKYGPTVKLASGTLHRPVVKLIPFTTSDKPWLAGLAQEAADTLEADDRFVSAVFEDVETRAQDYADGLADYRYELARDA